MAGTTKGTSATAEATTYPRGTVLRESRRDLLGTYLIDFAAMFLAFPLRPLPVRGGRTERPWSLGWLYSAGAIGGLLAAVTSRWVKRVHHHGRGVVLAAACWGSAIGIFGLATNVWWALALLVVAGAADTISGIFRTTMWNQTVPDEMRGRMVGIELLSFTAGPQLGQLRGGLMAQWTSLRFAIASGVSPPPRSLSSWRRPFRPCGAGRPTHRCQCESAATGKRAAWRHVKRACHRTVHPHEPRHVQVVSASPVHLALGTH